MIFEKTTLQVFSLLVFFIVPIRTYINHRKDTKEIQFFIGQFIYGMMWFGTWAVGMILVYQAMLFNETVQIIYIAFMYGFLTALASLLVLFLQKKMANDLDIKAQAQIQDKANKILSYRQKKGFKHRK